MKIKLMAGFFLFPFICFSTLASENFEDKVCSSLTLRKWTTALHLAQIRMDLKGMKVNYQLISEACPEQKLQKFCDGPCFLTLGRYFYFYTTSIQLLDQSQSSRGPEEVAGDIHRALNLMDLGLDAMMNQIEPSREGGGTDSKAFKEFVKNLASLKLMKARLQMSLGDAYYMNVTNPFAQYLQFKSGSAQEGKVIDNYMGLASLAYGNALNLIFDAMTDAPNTEASLQTEMDIFRQEIEERMTSISRGHAFLGINPFQVTDRSFQDLDTDILKYVNNLDKVEQHIQNYVIAARESGEKRENMELNKTRWFKEKEIALKAQKVVALRDQLGTLISSSQDLSRQMADEEYVQRSAAGKIKLQQEFQESLFILEQQKEDVQSDHGINRINEELSSIIDSRDQIRFSLGQSTSNTQIENEIIGIDQVIIDLNAKSQQLRLKKDQVDLQRGMVSNEIKVHQAEIGGLETAQKKLKEGIAFRNTTQNEYFGRREQSYKSDLDLYNRNGETQAALCEIQKELNNQNLEYARNLQKCFNGEGGGNCPWSSGSNEVKIMKEILGLDKEKAKNEVARYESQLRNFSDQLGVWRQKLHVVIQKKEEIQGLLKTAEAAYSAISSVPDVIAGIGAGTVFSASRLAKDAYDLIASSAQNYLLGEMAEEDFKEKVAKVDQQVGQIKNGLDLSKVQERYEQFVYDKRMIEIGNVSYAREHAVVVAGEENKLVKLRCEGAEIDHNLMVNRVKAALQELAFEKQRQGLNNQLDEADISVLNSKIVQTQLRVKGLSLEMERLNKETEILESELLATSEGIGSAGTQKGNLRKLQAEIERLTQSMDKVQVAIDEVRKRKLFMMDSATEMKLKKLKEMMQRKSEYFNQLSRNLESIADKRQEFQVSLAQIRKIIENTERQVELANNEILQGMGVSEDPELGQKLLATLDLDFERFTPALSHYVDLKGKMLNRLNTLLSQYGVKLMTATLNPEYARKKYYFKSDDIRIQHDHLQDVLNDNSAYSQVKWVLFPINFESKGKNSAKFLADLNQNGEVYFSFGKLNDPLNPFNFYHPNFSGSYETRIVDIRIGFDFPCRLNGSASMNLTHLGINQFDGKNPSEKNSFVLVTEPKSMSVTMLEGVNEAPPSSDSIIKDLFDKYALGYFRPRDLYNSTNIPLVWYGRSLNGMWKLSFESNAEGGRVPPSCADGARTPPLKGLYLWVWYTGKGFTL